MALSFDTVSALLAKHNRNLDDYANEYGEPGYSNPKSAILFANWNDVPKHIINGLERRGFELEWSDEWLTSSQGKAYRSSADSYHWTPSYIYSDGNIIGRDEIENNGSELDWYVNEYLLNDPDHAMIFDVDLSKFGFSPLAEDFETGLYRGQNDEPKKVFERLSETQDVIFEISGVGQFDVRWKAWVRPHDFDNSKAVSEGWDVFNCGDFYEIQKDDESDKFPNDESAVAFVKSLAASGSHYHADALRRVA